MKKIIENWKKSNIRESGLSRIHQHISEHESAIITGHRNSPRSRHQCVLDVPSIGTEKDEDADVNFERNRALRAILLKKGFGVTTIDGSYIENFNSKDKKKHPSIEVAEESFFVVNYTDDPKFADTLGSLSAMFCQDSVLIIPRGGREAYLLGTNEAWPGLGRKEPVGDFTGGEEAEFMSRVKRRPFVFKEVSEHLETYKGLSRNSRWAVAKIAEKAIKEHLTNNKK